MIQSSIPYLVLFSHAIFIVLFLSLIFRNSWGREAARLLGKFSVPLAFFISLVAVSGSLFYSNVVGFEPCFLCWWQRIFIYPFAVLFLVAWIKVDRGVFRYAVPLAIIGGLISLYHTWIQATGYSPIPCEAAASCTQLFVNAFGYITIPSMALSVFAFILLLAYANKVYKNA